MGDLYDMRNDEIKFWGGSRYVGPKEGTPLPHGGWTLVAYYSASHPDGEPAEVYVCAMPARFHQVTCKGKGIHLITGTGVGARSLVRDIAAACAEGTIDGQPGNMTAQSPLPIV